MFSRIAPALTLFVLSPFVGELLLGDIAPNQLFAFPILALLYGGGAIFIRELTRRSGRGWPTILLLAAAYGVLEEAFVTQTLFNPNYLGLRLLDYGFIPALGIGASWTVYVISLHIVWSISVPIALTEALFWQRGTRPWLGRFGFSVSGIMFALGALLLGAGGIARYHYIASSGQFIVSAIIIVGLVIAAFLLFPGKSKGSTDQGSKAEVDLSATKPVPRPLLLSALAMLAGSLFLLIKIFGASVLSLPAAISVPVMLAIEVMMVILVARASRSQRWSDMHRFALAMGGLLVYCWDGFLTADHLHGAASLPVQAAWAVLAIGLLALIASRLRRQAVLARLSHSG